MRFVGLAVLLCLAACGGGEPRRNVLLISVDTLRADRLGCYSEGTSCTPRLDALAHECAVFESAATPRAKTTPAIASLLSGRYPHEHGVRDLAQPLSSSVPLLQERLREQGYRCGAIVGNWVLGNERSGLARGFDLWCESLPQRTGVPPDDAPQRTARSLTDAALVALGLAPVPSEPEFEPRTALPRGDAPWFLWLHYMDPHGAYEPPAEHRVAARLPDFVEVEDSRDTTRQRVARYNVPEDAWVRDDMFDAAVVRARYDGEVRFLDAELGRLFDALRAAGELERTVIVLTADHGESLGEQDYYFEHGANCGESTVRVPLLVRAPGVAPGRRSTPASLVDVAPTVLELIGLAQATSQTSALRGESLAPALRGAERPQRPLFSEKVERADLAGAVQKKAIRLGRWKLVQSYAFASRPDGTRETRVVSEELYDLEGDGGEEWDLSFLGPPNAPLGELRRALAAFVAADPDLPELGRLLEERRRGLESTDPQAERTLRALGY
jgi:arylsulfatase A-like enzyme